MFKIGHNAWVECRADQAAFLIDAAAYYESLLVNLRRAERSVFILGWDIDSRLSLVPGKPDCPSLAGLLNQLARDRPSLDIYLLLWNFSNIYLFGREAFQSIKLGLSTDAHIHFHFDDQHPISASHHQKVVVIDDAVAYCGGIDLTGNRWDTERHLPFDPLRVNPTGEAYAPFHDVQMAVTGAPAAWLGELCRERWQRATGSRLAEVGGISSQRFNLGRDALRDAPVGISRTLPSYKGQTEVREVEQLFLDLIDAAKHTIYIENQYFTSSALCRRLSASLQRPNGPEIVMVLPKLQDSWLAKVTMGALSMRCILDLLASDRHRRFQAFYPEDERLPIGRYVNVHSKVMIVDGTYARVGSANMNNRSMGLDTECDLTIDGSGRSDIKAGVERFLQRLLADHTGRSVEQVASTLARHGSVRRAIAELSKGSPQSLAEYLYPEKIGSLEAIVGELEVVDLDQTVKLEKALDDFIYGGPTNRVRLPERVPAVYFLTFVFCITLAGILAVGYDVAAFRRVSASVIGFAPSTPLEVGALVVLGFVVSGLAFVPFNLLVVATATLFPAGRALAFVLLGGMASAWVGYGAGRLLAGISGSPTLRRAFAPYARVLEDAARNQTVLSVFLVRFFPLVPFSLLNLLAGIMGVRLKPYSLGTFLGLLPGAVSLVFFQRSLLGVLHEPDLASFLVFAVVTLAVTQVFSYLSRRFGSRSKRIRHA